MKTLTVIIFLILWVYTSFHWYRWKGLYDLKRFIKKTKRYRSVDDLIIDLNKKDVWYKELWLSTSIKIEQFLSIPRNIYRFFKKGIQRWVRGWGDEDCWGIDNFLTDIIPSMLKRLKEKKQGNLIIVGKMQTDQEIKKSKKLWNDILDNIIWTFITAKKFEDLNWVYVDNEKDRIKKEKFVKFLNSPKKDKLGKILTKPHFKYYLMTKDECKKYRKGWFYLQKYFFNL